MPEEQNQEIINETSKNPLKDPREWVDTIKWMAVFLVSVFIPIFGLIFFWVQFKPPFEVFLTLITVYLIVTLLLIKPLVFEDSKEKDEK